MKKLVYIFDGTLTNCNSVRDILYSILGQFESSEYEQLIISYYGTVSHPMKTEPILGYKTYRTLKYGYKSLLESSEINNFQKVFYLFRIFTYNMITKIPKIRHIYSRQNRLGFINKMLKLEKPDMVVYFSGSPLKGFSKICKKRKVPYISILYDTYLERPYITEKELAVEKDEIANSVGYFVPNFFVKGYLNYYNYKSVYSYKLPLLIPKNDVLTAYGNSDILYRFSYFGQMQSFRNSEGIKEIFKELGIVLDIFSTEKKQSDDVYRYHDAVSDSALHKIVASSDFLVAFDNGEPYAHYLPSKAYLYVSFTKPILVFGDNEDSALKTFLKDYPIWYYHNINDPSKEGLKSFINKAYSMEFSEETYSKYLEYLPQNALKEIVALIKNNTKSR